MKAEPCLPPPREKPALSNYRNYSALLMDQIHPGRTTARKPSAPRAGCPTASDRPIRPLPTPSADTSCGSAGPGHQPPLPAADGQPAPRARLAEAALENAGDHREFRSRPYHAAAAVGLGKNGDKKAAIIRLHCRAAQSGDFAVPDRHAPGPQQRDRPGHRAAGVGNQKIPVRTGRRGGHCGRRHQQGSALPAEGLRRC